AAVGSGADGLRAEHGCTRNAVRRRPGRPPLAAVAHVRARRRAGRAGRGAGDRRPGWCLMSAVGQLGAATAAPAAKTERRGRRSTAYLLLLPGGLWLLLFFVVPLVSLLAASLYDPNGSIETGFKMTWHFQNFADTMADYARPFGRSLWYAFITTVFCLIL